MRKGEKDLLEELALASGKTKAGLIRTALAVYAVAKEEEKHKNRLAVIDDKGQAVKQLVARSHLDLGGLNV